MSSLFNHVSKSVEDRLICTSTLLMYKILNVNVLHSICNIKNGIEICTYSVRKLSISLFGKLPVHVPYRWDSRFKIFLSWNQQLMQIKDLKIICWIKRNEYWIRIYKIRTFITPDIIKHNLCWFDDVISLCAVIHN